MNNRLLFAVWGLSLGGALTFGPRTIPGARAVGAPHYAIAHSTQQTFVRLTTSSEGMYRDIVVDGATLRYTYNQRNSSEHPGDIGSIARQGPHWTKADLVTETAALTPGEITDLRNTITQSKFLTLKSVYGTTKGRFYPTDIAALVNGSANKVEYRSGPHSTPRPAGFITVTNKLIHLVNGKCKHKIPA